MESGKKEVIICKKYDKNGNEMSMFPIYMIDEKLAHDYISSIQLKDEYNNTLLIKKAFPKDLLKQVENNSINYSNQMDKYKYEKYQQFRNNKYDNEPYYLKSGLSSINII